MTCAGVPVSWSRRRRSAGWTWEAGPCAAGGPSVREVVEVAALVAGRPQRAGGSGQGLLRGLGAAPLFQFGAVVRRQPGQLGDLLPTRPRYAPANCAAGT